MTVEDRPDHYLVNAAGKSTRVSGELHGDQLTVEVEGHRQRGTLAAYRDGYTLFLPGLACHFCEVAADTGEADRDSGDAGLTAPMNGTIIALLAGAGATVAADTPLLVMEAMKMEHTIRAPEAGTVKSFFYQPGDLVDGGALLVEFEAE